MNWTEGIIPNETEKGILSIHLKRYVFARPRCNGRVVLDLGCGTGYGSFYLAEEASRVTAVDFDPEVIRYACSYYDKKNVQYLISDAQQLPFADESFDIVCSSFN